MIDKMPHSHEEEPFITVSDGDVEFTMRPCNTELVRHIARWAMYDFIYHETEEDTSMYIFSEVPQFEYLAQVMGEMQYPLHLNVQEVSEDDKQAYEDMVIQQMWNGIPPEMLE